MYNVMWNGIAVGNVVVIKEGLYYRICCKCNLPDRGRFRILATAAGNILDLGICVPNGDAYCCVTRVPCKRFCGNAPVFTLINGDKSEGIPIADGQPFAHLDKLNTARLRHTNGQLQIITNPIQVPQGNDRNQEYPHKSVRI